MSRRAIDAARQGAMELRLRFRRADGAVLDEPLAVSRATVDPRHLLTLLDPRLERLPMGDGIDEIRVTASRTRRLRPVQAEFGAAPHSGRAEEEDSREIGRLVDTLTQRCGAKGVVSFSLVESHWPERAFAAGTPFARRRGQAGDPWREGGEGGEGGGGDDAPAGDRPSLLLTPPERADVLLDEGARLLALSWRGTTRRVTASVGPERIAVPWWDRGCGPDAAGRDYFRACTEEGRWLWIFHGGAGWFVHGEWA
jgi:protein ImuB